MRIHSGIPKCITRLPKGRFLLHSILEWLRHFTLKLHHRKSAFYDGVEDIEFLPKERISIFFSIIPSCTKNDLDMVIVCDLIVIIRLEINMIACLLSKRANLTYPGKVNSFRLISHSKLSPAHLNSYSKCIASFISFS